MVVETINLYIEFSLSGIKYSGLVLRTRFSEGQIIYRLEKLDPDRLPHDKVFYIVRSENFSGFSYSETKLNDAIADAIKKSCLELEISWYR
ncbi:hypothetical protein [Pollutibacter soli]|uniref:hypothetical protein n=1 Tax=Pollutibacter soli TaxID=3034157 RepID=UPI0030132385